VPVLVNIDAGLWDRFCQEATRRNWPSGDAAVFVLLTQFLQYRDAAGGGLRRALKLPASRRKAIAKQAGQARQAKLTPEERSAIGRRRAEIRWARERAKGTIPVRPPRPLDRSPEAGEDPST
jgi:hypothetical protein